MPNMLNKNTGEVELDFDRMQDIAKAVSRGVTGGLDTRSGNSWQIKFDHRKKGKVAPPVIAAAISDGWTANFDGGWVLSMTTENSCVGK